MFNLINHGSIERYCAPHSDIKSMGRDDASKLCYIINEIKFSIWEELLEMLKVQFIYQLSPILTGYVTSVTVQLVAR